MTKASKSLAMKYLKLSKYDVIINNSIAPPPAQYPNFCSAELKMLHNLSIKTCGWAVIKDSLATATASLYSKEELEAAISYIESDLGRSATLKGIELAKHMTEIMNQALYEAKE